MRIDALILVGHSEAGRGAIALDGTTEWDYHRALAPDVVHALYALRWNAESRWRTAALAGNRGLTTTIGGINAARPRCVVELHHNSGPPNRCGVEVLHWPGSKPGADLAAEILREVAPVWSLEKAVHRVVPQARSWNGPAMTDSQGRPVPAGPPLEILRATSCPSVIVETHFGSHEESQRQAHTLRKNGKLAEAIAAGVAAWLRGQTV